MIMAKVMIMIIIVIVKVIVTVAVTRTIQNKFQNVLNQWSYYVSYLHLWEGKYYYILPKTGLISQYLRF